MTVLRSSFWFNIENFTWSGLLNRRVVIIPGHYRILRQLKNSNPFIINGLWKVHIRDQPVVNRCMSHPARHYPGSFRRVLKTGGIS